jgi:hypothetical protein
MDAVAGGFIEEVSCSVDTPYDIDPIIGLGIVRMAKGEIYLAPDRVVPSQGGVCCCLVGQKQYRLPRFGAICFGAREQLKPVF